MIVKHVVGILVKPAGGPLLKFVPAASLMPACIHGILLPCYLACYRVYHVLGTSNWTIRALLTKNSGHSILG